MIAQSAAAHAAYSHPKAPQRNARALEYDLLARITKALSEASLSRDRNYPAFAAALDDNQRLWATFAADVAEDGNALPSMLRAQLFYLYEFTVKHTRSVRDRKASVEVLIEINTAVMRGLRGHGGAP